MKKIIPFLSFPDEAEHAVDLYICLFPDSSIRKLSFYGLEGPGPKATVRFCRFRLSGEDFAAMDGQAENLFIPAVSFVVNCATEEEADTLWNKLAERGAPLVMLDRYSLTRKYGWIRDRYGVTWQIDLLESAQRIVPHLLFTGEQDTRAEEAMTFYTGIFPDSRILETVRYGQGELGREGTIKRGRFLLADQEFMAMDCNIDEDFPFTPAISFWVECESQDELDHYWRRLSADGGQEQAAGWLRDRYGVSWQIVPAELSEWLGAPDTEKARRVQVALSTMAKIHIEELREAYGG
jgi:predicted 3-demethylubiquinone-9 3-methyltransferase (glyoxalase superfamily)